jgi:GR25 family glycosyltransferase involved in LPS biosynthesis
MKNLNNFFERIYCLNLDRRTDRWDHACNEFKKINTNVERFSAIDGLLLEYNDNNVTLPELGCMMSHLNIIKQCKNDNVSNVLIFEDDIKFKDNFISVFGETIDHIPTWDMLYFGGRQIINPTQIDTNIYKLHKCYTTHAYAANHTIFDNIIEYVSKLEKPIDVYLSELHSTFECFLMKDGDTSLTYQVPSHSDIRNGFVDYTGIL